MLDEGWVTAEAAALDGYDEEPALPAWVGAVGAPPGFVVAVAAPPGFVVVVVAPPGFVVVVAASTDAVEAPGGSVVKVHFGLSAASSHQTISFTVLVAEFCEEIWASL